MATSIVIAPIASDRLIAWREFLSELTGPRRSDWVQSQKRRGITREVVFLVDDPNPQAVYVVEGTDARSAMELLGGSADPFDHWYRQEMEEIHRDVVFPERVLDTRPGPGAWRGWRGWRGGS